MSRPTKHVQQHTKSKLHSMPTKYPPLPPSPVPNPLPPKKPTKRNIELTRKNKSRVGGSAGSGGGSKAEGEESHVMKEVQVAEAGRVSGSMLIRRCSNPRAWEQCIVNIRKSKSP